jgi:hypothetical protein
MNPYDEADLLYRSGELVTKVRATLKTQTQDGVTSWRGKLRSLPGERLSNADVSGGTEYRLRIPNRGEFSILIRRFSLLADTATFTGPAEQWTL